MPIASGRGDADVTSLLHPERRRGASGRGDRQARDGPGGRASAADRPAYHRSVPLVRRRFVLLGFAGACVAVLSRGRLVAVLHAAAARFETSSSPSVRLYDVLFGSVLAGFHELVEADVSAALSSPAAADVLEVGPGPGRLAVDLARLVPPPAPPSPRRCPHR